MKILRVIASVNPMLGGPVEGLIQSSTVMAESGHNTEVVTLDHPREPWLVDFPLTVNALGPRTRFYSYSMKLVPWIRGNAYRYDVIVIHGLWNFASIGTSHALRDQRTPYVVFTHGMLDPWFKQAYPFKSIIKQAYWLAFEGRVLRRAGAVLFTTDEEMRLASKAYTHHCYRGSVVSYGTVDAKGHPDLQRAAFRVKVPELGARPFLLFLGRIDPKKGCDLLIRAYANLYRRHPEYALVVAGPDLIGWRLELETLAGKLGVGHNVFWTGMLSGDSKIGALRSAEALVLPSHQENFGIVVAEAMSCSTPVLITNKVNIWREVSGSSSGLVATDNTEGVTDMLDQFMSMSPSQKRAMSERARAAFLSHFHVDAAARDLAAILNTVVARCA